MYYIFFSYHVPEIRIVTVEPLRAGRPAELIIKFTNPTQHQTVVTFLPLDLTMLEEDDNSEKEKNIDHSQPSSLLNLSSRQPCITVKPRQISEDVNASIAIPESKVILPPRDDAAEYDDSGDTHNIQDDPK